MTNKFYFSFLVFLFSSFSFAQDFQLVPHQDGNSGVTFQLPYTAGIHTGQISQAMGAIRIDKASQTVTGSFTVPIAGITTGNATRDCHMRESMGIDYSKSQFPNQHVCDFQNQVPAQGPDSIAFPNIEFDISGVVSSSGPLTLEPGKAFDVQTTGKWTVHGVSVQKNFTLHIAVESGGSLKISGTVPLLLSEFNIVVKPFLFITVGNTSKVVLDLTLSPTGN